MNARFLLLFSLFVIFSGLAAGTDAKSVDSAPITAGKSSNDAAIDKIETTSNDAAGSQKSNFVELNFQNASLANILEYLVQEKGYNLIPPGKELQDKKVSLITKKSISLDQAWDVLNTLLEINGFRIVKYGENNILRVVSTKEGANECMPVLSSANGDAWRDLPDSGEVLTYIYYLTNMKGDQAAAIIAALTGEKPIMFSDLDLCIIRAPSYKIKNALEIIDPFDKDQLKQTISFVKLQYTAPDAVAKLITEDIAGNKASEQGRVRFINNSKKDISFLSGNVRIIPDLQHNSLILLGQEKQIEKIEDFIKKVIDVEWGGEKTRVRIKELNYRGADQMQRTLEKIIKSTNQSSIGKNLAFRDVKIVAETTQGADVGFGNGNRLIISCDPQDWPKINALIENLDSLKPQVALEVMIVDASIDLSRVLEGHIRDTGYGILGDNVGWQVSHTATAGNITEGWNSLRGTLQAAAQNKGGDTIVTFGDSSQPNGTGLWGLLHAAIRESNSNLLSQPFIVVNNGEDCNFDDQEIRRVEGELLGRGNGIVQKMEPVSARNLIKLQPRINADGIVDMKIEISIESFTKAANVGADTNRRTLNTKACMGLGEVLILGGLKKTTKLDKKYDTPLLSELPIIGNFLKSKSKRNLDQSLFIFIRPSLIKPRHQLEPDDYTQFKLDYAKLNIKRTDDYTQESDPIGKLFFKPAGVSVREAEANSRSENYAPIDDFAQRKKLPVITDIRRDPYYRAQNKSSSLQVESFTQLPNKTSFKPLALKQRSLLDSDAE